MIQQKLEGNERLIELLGFKICDTLRLFIKKISTDVLLATQPKFSSREGKICLE